MAFGVSDPWRANFCAAARKICNDSFRLDFFARNAETHAVIGSAGNVTAWRQKKTGWRVRPSSEILLFCIFISFTWQEMCR